MTPIVASARSVLAFLLRADIWLVRLCAETTRRSLARQSAIAFSRVGNGFLYPVLAAILILIYGARGQTLIVIAIVNIGLLHCLYPVIKKWTARPRPYHTHPDLAPLLRPLDEHSFPSGHAMTLTAALVPIALVSSHALLTSLALWGAMAWARLASAHHYPSDVLGGTAIGLIVSYPISQLCMSTVAAITP